MLILLLFKVFQFQPTPSARRVTFDVPVHEVIQQKISTHTLRKEGDFIPAPYLSANRYFNPHPPQGG